MYGAEIDAAISKVLRLFPEVSTAWLFGSVAHGEARFDSDLDVALLFRTRGTTVLDNYELFGRIAAQLEAVAPGRRIDIVSVADWASHGVASTPWNSWKVPGCCRRVPHRGSLPSSAFAVASCTCTTEWIPRWSIAS